MISFHQGMEPGRGRLTSAEVVAPREPAAALPHGAPSASLVHQQNVPGASRAGCFLLDQGSRMFVQGRRRGFPTEKAVAVAGPGFAQGSEHTVGLLARVIVVDLCVEAALAGAAGRLPLRPAP